METKHTQNSSMIHKELNRFWGFAYLRPRTEKVVKARLVSLGIKQYLPMMPRARMHHSTKIVTDVPMVPGYIFLCADDAERSELRRREARFVQIELMRDERREEMLIRELNVLQQCELLARTEPVLVNPDIMPGDEVLVTAGPLQGLMATVRKRDDDRDMIVINLTILNKHVEYPVSAETLRKITS